MKRTHLLLIALIAVLFACSKDLVTMKDAQVVSFANAKALVGEDKTIMLSSVSVDPLFQDYLSTLMDIQKTHNEQLNKAQKYDATKWKPAVQPKTETEYISHLKSLGFSNPELILAKYKEANGKLAKLYKKYPNFSNSLSKEEKEEFFKKETLKFLSK
ncbi:hypothetical protein EZ428_02770 [Pedobacter frigiditerrae]|uniref:DUF4296 domain-containing protein n=1 Tax=Pedobacter frigiditerrae TaxID=2530452 RepID=A0A4R0N1P8_9SPHI|nr:hypothetical protein [Pedobacter frigiditerrae]TCC93711.1 hypothetical protein EZ428_02770 [Pedobacter frigiditerrae]